MQFSILLFVTACYAVARCLLLLLLPPPPLLLLKYRHGVVVSDAAVFGDEYDEWLSVCLWRLGTPVHALNVNIAFKNLRSF